MWGNATYLILIVGWALPIILLQWLIGREFLLRRWKVLVPGILIPTLYLTCVDSIALGAGTWTISPQQSFNIFIPVINVPIEEALFFLMTNTLLIQGLILAMDRIQLWNKFRRIYRDRKTAQIGAKFLDKTIECADVR